MKTAAHLVLAALCAGHAFAQGPGVQGLSEDGARSLAQLRLHKSQQALVEAPAVDPRTRQRLIDLADQDLTDAALRDLSAVDGARRTAARVRVHELARIAETPLGAEALAGAGWNRDRLRALATAPRAPMEELKQLQDHFGVDAYGRLLVRPGVLIVNPEKPAPADWLPGKLPPGYQGPPPVWRRGLLFATAIGIHPKDGAAQAFCSGTVVAKYWIVTAAHCLRHEGQRLGAGSLFAFLPYQAGTLEVRNAAGGVDRNLRQVSVAEVKWIGDGSGESFPASEADMAKMVLAGMDLAMLRLDAADVNALPVAIPSVRLAMAIKQSPVSMVGFGLSNKAVVDGLSMAVGVRDRLPAGAETGDEVFFFAAQTAGDKAALCGGDSGGGLFLGRVNGAPGNAYPLFGVVSGLVGSLTSGYAGYCLAGEQAFTSVLAPRNRKFFCDAAADACPAGNG